MRGRPLLVVGDALLDRDLDGQAERLAPDAPVPVVDEITARSRPGGAALAAALAALDGRPVTLISALARDEAGTELATLLDRCGVKVLDLGLGGSTPEKVRIRAQGRSLLRLDHGPRSPGPVGRCPPEAVSALEAAGAVLVADYGRGVAAEPTLRDLLGARSKRTPVVWDPHPRGPEPVHGAQLVTPNQAESEDFVAEPEGGDLGAVTDRARTLARMWRARDVAVTLGPRGALLVSGDGPPLVVPARKVSGGDTCGSGDRFASMAAGLLADGALVSEAVTGAVAASSSFVAAGGASSFELPSTVERTSAEPGSDTVARVRERGGTVVATGGCFDLLHAGHVKTLEAARSLGDCLVVCLNSDQSVRRLKGPDRPLVPQGDRAAVLSALACVDDVVVFDEDTPAQVLERLQPDVFAKGGDYSGGDLPEAATVARWGGRVVILPYVEGRSTTNLVTQISAVSST